MTDDIAISLTNVSKVFKRYHRPVDRLKEIFLLGKQKTEEFWALRDINLEILRGETVGIIGRNGSGKSTLLQIIAGTLQPTTGHVKMSGRVSALLELGSGFNPEFTGRQNVFFNGQILGLSQTEIESRFDNIAAFADIGSFIDQPVKTYSSGMFVRLAFAVAVNVSPQILIVDEALAVGDGIFVHKCMRRIKQLQDSGKTILFVSHDTGSINRLCSSCIWIDSGHIAEVGLPVDISKHYQAWTYTKINSQSSSSPIEVSPSLESKSVRPKEPDEAITASGEKNPYTMRDFISFPNDDRCGTGRCEIVSFNILGDNGNNVNFLMPKDKVLIVVEGVAHDDISSPLVGVQMFDRLRTPIVGWNTPQYSCNLKPLVKGDRVRVSFEMYWPYMKSDSYILEAALADGSQDNHEMLDWLFSLVLIESGEDGLTFGLFRMNDVQVSYEIEKPTLHSSRAKL